MLRRSRRADSQVVAIVLRMSRVVMCDNDPVHRDRRRLNGGRAWRERLRGLRHHLSLSRRAQFVSLFFLVVATALVPWTFFLGFTLPPRYDAGHWRLLWTGFDAALIAVLLLAAWAAWYRRQILAGIAVVAGTLLICDAWFDMVTSFGHRDEWRTMLTGFGGELPLGIFFFWLYRRIALTTMTVLHPVSELSPRHRRLRDFPIVQPKPEAMGIDDGDRHDPAT
jgi:hypothetical protein